MEPVQAHGFVENYKASRRKRTVKEVKRELSLQENKLTKLKHKLLQLKRSTEASKRTYSQMVHIDLINSCPVKYIQSFGNGREILTGDQDASKIEKQLKGVLAGQDLNLQEIVDAYSDRENSKA